MKKKILRITSLALVTCLLLCSCKNKTNDNSDNANAATADSNAVTTSTEDASDEPVTLTIWMKEYDGIDLDNNLMTKELEKRLNVNLEFETFSSAEDTATQFNLSIASGEYPDIYMSCWFSPEQIMNCVNNEIFIPLNDYVYAEGGSNYLTALKENKSWESMVTANDGNIYTFFYNDTGVHKASEYKMWYRQDWLKKLGWENPPSTPEEFKQYLMDIRDKDANGNGDTTDEIPLMGYYNGRQTDPICFLMNPFELYTNNFYYITDDNKIHFSATTDGWRNGLKYIADLYAEGLIAEETYVQDQSSFKALLNRDNEKAMIGTFPSWYNGAEIDTGVMSWFTYEALAPLKGNSQQTAARYGGNFNLTGAITSQCKNPEVAFKVMDYLIGEEGQELTEWGVEGKSYEWVDEESYYGTDQSIKRLMKDTDVFWNSGFYPRYDTEEYRYATTKSEEAMKTDNTWVLLKAAKIYEPYYVNHNIPDIAWCDDANVTQEVSDFNSLLGDYIKTMDTQFIMGQLNINDDSAWQEYLDTLDEMGLQQYIKDLTIYYGLE